MPKTMIYTGQPYRRDEAGNEIPVQDLGGEGHTLQRVVRLGWTKDLYAELATVEVVAETGEHVPGTGTFVQLERDQMNRLIRAFRDARDDVFGKDA